MALIKRSRGVELRQLNTFGIAASANDFAELQSEHQLAQVQAWLRGRTPVILGAGSNLLITDDIEAPLLAVRLNQSAWVDPQADGSVLVHASAGLSWQEFVTWTLAQRLAGLENLALIPGSVGASPVQNIGAYGVEIKDRMDSLRAWNWRTGELRLFRRQDCQFGYRDSIFKARDGDQWVILSVALRLHPFGQSPLVLDYGEIRAELALAQIQDPTAGDVGRAVEAIRRRKLPDPRVLGNAGSFFKNPQIAEEHAARLKHAYPALPCYPSEQVGLTKVSAGWLIDQCGWKGFREGDAGIHKDHALVLINYGQSSGHQLLALARKIQKSVADRFAIALEPEPRILPGPL